MDPLTDPKTKLTNRMRKNMKAERAFIVTPETKESVKDELKLLRKLEVLPINKVLRRLKQYARRSSTARHLLEKMSKSSPFRRALELDQLHNVNSFRQTVAELKARALKAQGRLAPPCADDCARVEQPHSDNNVTGPTS